MAASVRGIPAVQPISTQGGNPAGSSGLQPAFSAASQLRAESTVASIWLTEPLTPPPLAPFCCSRFLLLPFFSHRSAVQQPHLASLSPAAERGRIARLELVGSPRRAPSQKVFAAAAGVAAPTSAKPVAAALRCSHASVAARPHLRPATCNSAFRPRLQLPVFGPDPHVCRLACASIAHPPDGVLDPSSTGDEWLQQTNRRSLCVWPVSILGRGVTSALWPSPPAPAKSWADRSHTPPASEEDKTDPARLRFRVQFTGLHATGAAALLKPAARSHDRRLLCA
ncbi:uncharacterized protein TrAtP1_008815 [Trichoderma atroviride]|uniref:Uncharacterized protein n=1 Tax=Hypocrea atroviridis (strain ATCC 20476 / IMI 206040) TaxID=452589 RepID=G9NXW9_HYPAI|nr:uncharacterized protein TRIATDRAFT_309678 [Trichoderma atroviride IMI 206040]EHK44298.1 hypothetical protein TRIATDRAFT_309678 [Trichoderma atroviride IMI 206040]UKZ67660.1 hypothetical protein TrAtP1_008815 [Trichoderma atroviride]